MSMTPTKKILALLFITCALTLPVFAQDAGNQAQPGDEQVAPDAQDGLDGQPDFNDPEFIKQQQEAMEAQRSKVWGCYFLAKHRLFTKSEELGKVLAGSKGEGLFKRMVVNIMKTCLNKIAVDESSRVISGLQGGQFNIDEWDYIHGFKLDDYKKEDISLTLDEEEKYIYTYYEKIDENLRNQYEETAEKEEKERTKGVDYEPKIGGLSLKETSPFVKTVYAAGVLGTIAILFFLAYKKLFTTTETPYERVKRQRLEKKREKSQ